MPPRTATPKKQRVRRHKIALACETCREKKMRCDGGKPVCGPCVRRSRGVGQCVYTSNNPRSASQDEYIRVLHNRIEELEKLCMQQRNDDMELAEESFVSAGDDTANSTVISDDRNELTPKTPQVQSIGQPGANPALSTRDDSVNFNDDVDSSISEDPAQAGSLEANSRSPHFDSPGHVTGMGQISGIDNRLRETAPAQEFYGSSSTASLMRCARSSILSDPPLQTRGDSSTLHGSRNYSFNEPPYKQFRMSEFSLPPRPLADHLLHCFWHRVHCLYPFFDRPSFETAYENLWKSDKERINTLREENIGLGSKLDSGPQSIVFHSALNAMFALGCHFSDIPVQEREGTAHSFFMRCKHFIGLDLLEFNTVGVVQTLLVTALYLQSSPYPSRCWNSIGIACRVAQGLGLHEPHARDGVSDFETEVRRRTWHGCVIMDIVGSMTHGRPTMTSHLSPVPLPNPENTYHPPLMTFYIATIQLYSILDRILSDVYNAWRRPSSKTPSGTLSPERRGFDVLADIERQLQVYEAELPTSMNWIATASSDTSPKYSSLLSRQKNVLRGRFNYIRLLLYRPIFTDVFSESTSRKRLHQNNSMDQNQGRFMHGMLQTGMSERCAVACVMAAVDLVQLVNDTYQTAVSDAWWYNGFYTSTAAIVLLMSYSIPSISESISAKAIQESWKKCEQILSEMASFSQSAATSLRFLQAAHGQMVRGKPSVNRGDGGRARGINHLVVPDGQSSRNLDRAEIPPSPVSNHPFSNPGASREELQVNFEGLPDELGWLSWLDIPDMPGWSDGVV